MTTEIRAAPTSPTSAQTHFPDHDDDGGDWKEEAPPPGSSYSSIQTNNTKPLLDRKWLQKLVKNDVIYATAPMIEQSDTAFRILTRKSAPTFATHP